MPIYRGNNARIQCWGNYGGGADYTSLTQTAIGMSDFSITFSRGTVEQELVGEIGNYSAAGSLSVEGSLTACKLDNTLAGYIVGHCISGNLIHVSGSVGDDSLKFFFISAMVTNFDLSLGDADTITEGSFDFIVLDPANVRIYPVDTIDGNGTWVSDSGPKT
jgi:hypothetical protein